MGDEQEEEDDSLRYMEAKKTKKKTRRSCNNIDRSYRPGKYDSKASDDDELDDSLFKSSSGRKSRKKKRSKSTSDNQNNLLYEDEQEEEDDSLVAQNASVEKAKKQCRRKSQVDESYTPTSDIETDDKEDENGFDSDKSVFAGYHGLKKE